MTPADDDFDVDALERRFEAALARSRELPRALSPDELATLALPPFWTEPALARVLGRAAAATPRTGAAPEPAAPEAVIDAVIEKAGPFLHVEGDPGHRVISVREPNAPALVALLREHRALDRWAAIGGAIASLDGLPPVLRAWADLARQLGDRSDYELSRELLARVAAACEAGRPGDVHDAVDGAAALARGLGPPLSGAVRVAQHRIRRWYAVQRDRRKLAHFVPRRAALAAIEQLLDDRDPAAPWALHVVGAAGMGKTSLIRHLATEIAARRGLQVARIDFDHLSPAYPAHEPGQLIASLADELTALIETEGQDKLIGFVESALVQLRDLAGLGALDVRALLDRREMQELMAWFGSLLQSFAHPVLVLDTCEELTKLDIESGTIPSVEATFLMLERLHAQAPRLRVVLAGRRLLAGGYANWTAPEAAARQAGVTASRPFLMLHELRGFDAAEARGYLERRLPPARRTDQPLIAKLLTLSPEPLRVSALGAAADPAPHYNPFDLARHAEWVEADPDVLLAAFDASNVDPYVEVRIVQRMGELEPLLPAIALLRRFDLAMLSPALPPDGDPQAIFDKLARHEWLHTTHLGGRTVLEVDRGLPDRIERCLAAHRGIELARARTQLGAALRGMVEAGSLLEIPVEVYDGALRILPPDDAVALWQSIEARIGDQADWAWAAKLTRDLIATGRVAEPADERAKGAGSTRDAVAEGGADTPARRLVAFAIHATYASALVHAGGSTELEALWQGIERGAACVHERAAARDPGAARRGTGEASPAWLLQQRARLGGVAARAAAPAAAAVDQAALVAAIEAIAGDLARGGAAGALASSRCAAVEAVVELAERDPARAAPELAALLDHLAFDEPALAAFAIVLRARIEALASRDPRAVPELPDPVPALPATVLDWRPPGSLPDRLRLEVVRWCQLLDLSADPALRSAIADAAPTWRSWADRASSTICGDRLRSAVITVLGSAAQTSAADAIDAATEPRCAAHRQFPPLAFTQGRVALARGDLSGARAIARRLPRPWAQRMSCELARWTRQPDDLAEDIFLDDLDAETTAAIAAARAVVHGVLRVDQRSSAAPAAPAPDTGVDLARLHPSLRGAALRARLRRRALDGGDLGTASSERAVMTAIEEAELLDVERPEAALRLFQWAVEGAARLALTPARLRASFGAWLAAMHADDPQAAARADALLREGLIETPEELAYRRALEHAQTDALRRARFGVASNPYGAVAAWAPERKTIVLPAPTMAPTTLGAAVVTAARTGAPSPPAKHVMLSAGRSRGSGRRLLPWVCAICAIGAIGVSAAMFTHGEGPSRDPSLHVPYVRDAGAGTDQGIGSGDGSVNFDAGAGTSIPRDAGAIKSIPRDARFSALIPRVGSDASLDAGNAPEDLDAGAGADASLDAGNAPEDLDAGTPGADAATDGGVPTASATEHSGSFDTRLVLWIALGLLAAVGLLKAIGWIVFRDKHVPLPMPPPVDASAPAHEDAGEATPSPASEPRTVIAVTRLSADTAEIAIAAQATGEPVRGKASIATRGEWPVPVGRDLEPALVALAGLADRRSIAIDPSPELAPRCWEGVLHALAPSVADRLAFHRVLPAGQVPPSELAPARIEADGSLADLLERAWRGKAGIVHVLRRFSRTRQGRTVLTRDYARDIAISSEEAATEFDLDLAHARLVIVQCDPSTAEIATRANTSEPELAREYLIGGLRRSSACGLVLPPVLPIRLFDQLAGRLAAGVGDCTHRELIETARDLRAYLREQRGAADEITLFLREPQPG